SAARASRGCKPPGTAARAAEVWRNSRRFMASPGEDVWPTIARVGLEESPTLPEYPRDGRRRPNWSAAAAGPPYNLRSRSHLPGDVMAKKRKRDDRKARRPAPPTRLELRLAEAEALLEEGDYAAADALLDALDRANPMHPDVIGTRMAAAAAAGDFRLHLTLVERLARLRPYDREARLILAGSYLSNGWPALALRAFREFLARWPDDPEAGRVRSTAAEIEAGLPGQ